MTVLVTDASSLNSLSGSLNDLLHLLSHLGSTELFVMLRLMPVAVSLFCHLNVSYFLPCFPLGAECEILQWNTGTCPRCAFLEEIIETL